ncbi:hypothetical protein GGH94_005099 [Coemansia aciculifera]|uniref:DUF3074 domain-containing protein n=2 Tax=Coemansia TaxID=4863 RepID=A0A9W8GRR4_9FUNG|nr:hypothetical protein GGI19_005759 [Coemansia pectinata]KAJ2861112.1 hypothetical protein GGH94_005099 [Coemansia aciculifera]KAJ2872475.1 hypothetical protein GGH93_003989 [Coemansia aciculifera]KAJ2881537.1 hypothetical protein H4R27_004022 [Coemansia aciculifera]
MVLTPIRRAVIPSPLEDQRKFDDFITQYLNKCDDLLSYTKRYPIVKQTPLMTVQRQNRNPHETHRWLRRDIFLHHLETSYDELKQVMFSCRAEHLPRWMPQLLAVDNVETVVPNLCQVFRYSYKSQGLKANRDYCQLVVMREFLGETAKLKPRIFTPSASMANLALLSRTQSSTSINAHQFADNAFSSSSRSGSPTSPVAKSLKPVRSMADFQAPHKAPAHNQFAGLTQAPPDISDDLPDAPRPIRRFQVVTVPIEHRNCTEQRGFVRAFYETYEEVREYSDGHVEWSCIHHSDFSGWVPSFVADHSIATAFPKEAEALLDYVQRIRTHPLNNEY